MPEAKSSTKPKPHERKRNNARSLCTGYEKLDEPKDKRFLKATKKSKPGHHCHQKPKPVSATSTTSEVTVLGKVAVTDDAMLAIDEFVEKSCAVGVEGLRQEFQGLKAYIPPSFEHNHSTANANKNRYKDVVCLDATRVVLTLNVPPESDYIHANWVKLPDVDYVFIATQGPLESTICDFWRMIYQEEAKTILMLSKTVEDGRVKCAQYWPVESGAYKTYGCMFVNNKKVEKKDKFITSTIEVLPEGCSNSVILKLVQMTDWPDRGVPQSGMSVLRMLKLIQRDGPCVVHCSAGIGRTGTVIFVQACLQRLWKGQRLNVPEMLKEIRAQRASSIQTEGQYVFVHLTVLYYISAKLPKHRELVSKFHDTFKAANLF